MADRVFIRDYLSTYFDEVDPKDFYRGIFPKGDLQAHGAEKDGKCNAIAVELLPKEVDKPNAKRYVITDELDILDQLLKSDHFIIVSPISYIGKSRQSKNARYIYAMAIDLDGITADHYLVDLFHQMEIEFIPKPTYIVWSGTGLHLYYQFEKPIPCYKNVTKQLSDLKTALTKKIWNVYVSELHEKPQIESLFQGFRLVGGVTKNNNRTSAYLIGDKVSVEYLNYFVPKESQVTEFSYKSDLPLSEAKKKYPEWYEKRIVQKQPKGTWTANKAVYDWWLKKLHDQIAEGHRYYGIMVLAIYAKKCGVPIDVLEQDAFGLVEEMDQLTVSEDNHFTREDVLAALEMFNDNYITFPIDTITQLTDIHIEKNKRNGRKQADHIKVMNAMRAVKMQLGEPMQIGRPSKEDLVADWQRNNPKGTKAKCIKDTGLSKPTVYKYWKES